MLSLDKDRGSDLLAGSSLGIYNPQRDEAGSRAFPLHAHVHACPPTHTQSPRRLALFLLYWTKTLSIPRAASVLLQGRSGSRVRPGTAPAAPRNARSPTRPALPGTGKAVVVVWLEQTNAVPRLAKNQPKKEREGQKEPTATERNKLWQWKKSLGFLSFFVFVFGFPLEQR